MIPARLKYKFMVQVLTLLITIIRHSWGKAMNAKLKAAESLVGELETWWTTEGRKGNGNH